jgi:hypothetical protein
MPDYDSDTLSYIAHYRGMWENDNLQAQFFWSACCTEVNTTAAQRDIAFLLPAAHPRDEYLCKMRMQLFLDKRSTIPPNA